MKERKMKRFVFYSALITGLFLLMGLLLLGGPNKASGVYGDTTFERQGREDGFAPAVFPHWVHRIRYSCSACHPEIFQAKRGKNPINMESIRKGEACGVCHNGLTAWGVRFDTCSKCHF